MRDRFAAERVAKRGEHAGRMQQRGLDIGFLALRHPRQELVDAEGLGIDPGPQLGRQLPQDVSRLAAREALVQGLQSCTARSAASWLMPPASCRAASMISS